MHPNPGPAGTVRLALYLSANWREPRPDTLAWERNGWSGAEDAIAPAPMRPGPDGRLAPFSGAGACPSYNDMTGNMASLPARPAIATTPWRCQARNAGRDVVYLFGEKDNDANHPLLDKSCMGEAQGPHRYARGHCYFARMLQASLGAHFLHRLHDVAGVGHDNKGTFRSICGLAAPFDAAGCPKYRKR